MNPKKFIEQVYKYVKQKDGVCFSVEEDDGVHQILLDVSNSFVSLQIHESDSEAVEGLECWTVGGDQNYNFADHAKVPKKYVKMVESIFAKTKLLLSARIYDGEYEFAGDASVDSGTIHIGDPCYLSEGKGPYQNWREFCTLVEPKMILPDPDNFELPLKFEDTATHQLNFEKGHPGLGVVIKKFGGDGTYPVFVKKNDKGEVMAAQIVFNFENEFLE